MGSIAQKIKIKEIKSIHAHIKKINSVLLLSDGRLASCSDDKSIQIFNLNNYHCDITIEEAHTKPVTYISLMDNNQLLSCSLDKTIKIWNIFELSYECEYIIKDAHSEGIKKVIPLTYNRIASCSHDQTIRIWKSNYPYNLIKQLQGGYITSITSIMQLKGKEKLIVGSRNYRLTIWSLLSYQCETILNQVHCFETNSLFETDNNIFVGGNIYLTIINKNNLSIEQRVKHEKLLRISSFIQLNSDNILCGCEMEVMCIFNIPNNTITIIQNKDIDNNYDLLRINNQQFISCSWGYLKFWEY